MIFFSPWIWLNICQRANTDTLQLTTNMFWPDFAGFFSPKSSESGLATPALDASPYMHRFHEYGS